MCQPAQQADSCRPSWTSCLVAMAMLLHMFLRPTLLDSTLTNYRGLPEQNTNSFPREVRFFRVFVCACVCAPLQSSVLSTIRSVATARFEVWGVCTSHSSTRVETECSLFIVFRPDITVMVDWVLNTKLLTYLSVVLLIENCTLLVHGKDHAHNTVCDFAYI